MNIYFMTLKKHLASTLSWSIVYCTVYIGIVSSFEDIPPVNARKVRKYIFFFFYNILLVFAN